jgi:hypothetical protein
MKISKPTWRPRLRTSLSLVAAAAIIGGVATIAPNLTAHRDPVQLRAVSAADQAQGTVTGTRTPDQCLNTLDCTVSDIDSWSIAQRIELVQALQNGPAQQFQSGFKDWNAIIGILYFFQFHSLGAPGSWISYTDAGILVGIERGLAQALGFPANQNLDANPGAALWATFLNDLLAGKLTMPANKVQHDLEWGQAEQQSTDWGISQAPSGVQPSQQEGTWFQFSQVFRWIMQNEQPFAIALTAINNPDLTMVFDTFTAVDNPATTFFFSELAWQSAGLLNALNNIMRSGSVTSDEVSQLLTTMASSENSCTTCNSMPNITLTPLTFTGSAGSATTAG